MIEYPIHLANADIPPAYNTNPLDEWLNAKMAADYLKLSVKQVQNMASNGQLPHYKLGRRLRFSRRELDNLLTKNKGVQHGGSL